MDQPPLIDSSNLPSPIFQPRPGWGGQLAAWFRHNTYRIVFRGLMLIVVVLVANAMGRSWAAVRLANIQATPTPTPQQTTYEFVAAHGVGMTTLAGRALDSYLDAQYIELDPAEHLYAVDALARQAGWAPLTAGQTVTFSMLDIGHIVIDAKTLSSTQHASWSRLVK